MDEELARAKTKRLKVNMQDGRVLFIGEVFNKFTKWIQMMVAVGDTAVQFDPVHAALPWAAFRFVLKAAVNYHEAEFAVWEGIEKICEDLVWVNLQEVLYLETCSTPGSSSQLRKALITFYLQLFMVLARYVAHLRTSKQGGSSSTISVSSVKHGA